MSSNKYKIGYLDEDEIWMALVRNKLSPYFDVNLIGIPIPLEEIWGFIIEKELDALIVDFQLFDSGKVSYDGGGVVEEITRHNQHFPIIVLTAHENSAFEKLDNVLIIKGKKLINDAAELPNFVKMLDALIRTYKTKLNESQRIIQELQKKDILSAKEESLLFNAQRYISETCYDDTVPVNQYSMGYSKQLQSLLDTTNALLKEIKETKH